MRFLAISTLALIVSSYTAYASELGYTAYIGIDLDSKRPFFGVRWAPEDPLTPLGQSSVNIDTPHVGFDLRYGGERGSVLAINGVPLEPVLMRKAAVSGEPGKTGDNKINWKLVASVAIGVGLIAAVTAADDVTVKACSGSPCLPEQKIPQEQAELAEPVAGVQQP